MTNDLQNSAPGPEFMLHLLAVCGIFKIQTQQLSCYLFYFFCPFLHNLSCDFQKHKPNVKRRLSVCTSRFLYQKKNTMHTSELC